MNQYQLVVTPTLAHRWAS